MTAPRRSDAQPSKWRARTVHTVNATTPDEQRKAEARRRLRVALDGVELLPEETSDERLLRASAQADREESDRDAEFQRNKPPHHG